ncbi:hypothetical protein N657DRAFT_648322 [Parathielavia appendiculata]|uniref:Uncharacterized protein n=1 Tax=Parathielavia appendiculata TaxID=2587402 RepID=A0AAN6TQW8_9PEZI|nr:hypothetical protein N657DRAFT_650745 [Parathielavia appendiculata]KAK4120963.1 hypothetical protein N657DRAFT_648322 [Parathielavia appendiculata]
MPPEGTWLGHAYSQTGPPPRHRLFLACSPDASRDRNSTIFPSVQYSHHGPPSAGRNPNIQLPVALRGSPHEAEAAVPTVSCSRPSKELPHRRSSLGRTATNQP